MQLLDYKLNELSIRATSSKTAEEHVLKEGQNCKQMQIINMAQNVDDNSQLRQRKWVLIVYLLTNKRELFSSEEIHNYPVYTSTDSPSIS